MVAVHEAKHRGEDDAVFLFLDGVGGADAGARGIGAVHAHGGRRLHGGRALEVVEVDHRVAAMAGALAARLLARPAADAPVRVDEELADHAESLSMRTAAALNSGIPAIGS